MSTQAPVWYITQYDNRAFHIYQNKGNKLRPTVTMAGRVEADKAVFWKAGKGTARVKLKSQRAVPMNTDRKKIEATLKTWEAFDTVEEYDLDRMSVNEREIVAQSGAMALGRATDIEVYKTIAADAATSGTRFIDHNAAAFSAAYALEMCNALQLQKVPWDGNVFCGLPPLFWNQFISYRVVNSSDHVGQDLPFVKATDTRYWNGVNWFLNPEEDPGDFYPVPAANQQDIFMWHRSAIGWGNNTDLRSIWDWDNYESWWTVNMQSKGCAVTMQAEGYIRGRFASNSSITIS
jgi:Phage capsid protein